MKILVNSQDKAFKVNGSLLAVSSYTKNKTLTGNAPLTFTADSAPLVKLKQTGKCTQASTPTPSSPVDIKCNNGKIVARYESGLPLEYKQIASMAMNNNCYWEIPNFPLYGSDTLKFSFMVMATCNVLGAYSGSADGDNYSLYVTAQTGNYLRYGSGAYRSGLNTYVRYDATISPTGTSGLYFNSTWSPLTFTTPTNLCIGSTSLTATSAKFRGTFYGAIEVVGRAKFIPCERVSDSVVGWYDIYSDRFYEPASGSTNPTKGSYVTEDVVGAVEGTDEIITLGQQTAGVVNLFGIGNDGDMQDVISGTVTRKYGVKVLDGTENWDAGSSGTDYRKFSLEIPDMIQNGGAAVSGFCSHYKWEYANIAGDFYFAASSNVLQIVEERSKSLSTFKTFLAQQYAAGTPVIVVYPLATSTAEQVTPQPLNTSAGSNTISVTAEVSNIPIEVIYTETE